MNNAPERRTVSEYFEDHPGLFHVPTLFKLYKKSEVGAREPSIAKFAEWLDETSREELLQLMESGELTHKEAPENHQTKPE